MSFSSMLRRRMGLLNLPCIAPTVVAALLLVSSLLVAGCGGSAVMIDVTVTGLPPESRLVQVSAQLNGQFANEVTRALSGAPSSFLVRLPSGSRGLLKLTASGLPENGCAEAEGTAEQTIDADATYKLTIALQPLAVPSCQVAVELVGPGEGSVRMSADGASDVNCVRTCAGSAGCTTPTRCTMRTRYAGEVRMQATPGGSSYFSNWAGVCSGREVCKRTVERTENVARANFINPPVCSGGNWCWDYPLPQGGNLYNVKARSANDVWAVGDSGLILHWDGTRWGQISTGQTAELRAIATDESAYVYFGGYLPYILRWDGAKLEKSIYTGNPVLKMWLSSSTDVWFASDASGFVFHVDMNTGIIIPYAAGTQEVSDIWGADKNNVWFANADGSVHRWDGASVKQQLLPVGAQVLSLHGFGRQDVWGAGDAVYHWDGTNWSPITDYAHGYVIWGSSETDIWIGNNVKLYHYDGTFWSTHDTLTVTGITGISGSGRNNVLTVGYNGYIANWNGTKWTTQTGAERNTIYSIWGTGSNDVWAVGDMQATLHFDGLSWKEVPIAEHSGLRVIWGKNADDIWAVGGGDTAYRWNGAQWMPAPHPLPGKSVAGLWGASTTSIWAVMWTGEFLHWDGKTWTERYSTMRPPNTIRVWGSSENDVWAASENTIYQYDGVKWSAKEIFPYRTGIILSLFGFSSQDIWVSGVSMLLFHWNGNEWRRISVGVPEVDIADNYFSGFWGSNPSDSWVIGPRGVMLRAYRDVFNPVPTGTVNRLWTIWGAGPQDIWVAGERSTILRYRP